MDEKKFKEELSKIAEWYTPIVTNNDHGGGRKPMPTSKPNEKLGPVIKELLPTLNPCEWCGIIGNATVKNHTIRFTTPDGKRPDRRWEHRCQQCKRLWDPKTGIVKEKPKSKYQIAKESAAKCQQSPYWCNNLDNQNNKT
jgi:hypothetical protein